MHIAEIKNDDSGELITGMFYSLEPWPDEDARNRSRPGTCWLLN
jgi:hypothetical protein